MSQKYLIVGLGNFDSCYDNTRHNMGFEVIKYLAKRHQAEFSKKVRLKGLVASYCQEDKKIYLLMPLTYMNESGVSVALTISFYQIPIVNILVVVDDIAIDLGQFRLKSDSGTGGHNGLKSIEQHLNTDAYARLRVGIGRGRGDLTKFVLGRFSNSEQKLLPEVIEKSSGYVEDFINQGLTEAMNKANVRAKKTQNEETK